MSALIGAKTLEPRQSEKQLCANPCQSVITKLTKPLSICKKGIIVKKFTLQIEKMLNI